MMGMRQRVLLTGPAPNVVSGVSTHIGQLVNSVLQEEVEFTHFQVGSEGKSESAFEKVTRYLASPFQLGVRIVAGSVELVHINSSLDRRAFWRDAAYVLVAKSLRRRIVYQVHGGALEEFAGGSRVLRAIVKKVLSIPNAIVVLSSVELKSYQELGCLRDLRWIPNAIRLSELEDESPRGVRPSVCTLVYVGRLAFDKGIFDAITATGRLVRRGYGGRLRLLIAGSGPAEGALREQVSELRLQDIVRFVGPIFGKRKARFWSEADLFIFPTFHNEGLPYSVLESIASGTPVVATRKGGIIDVIQEGKQGVFVNEHDPSGLAAAIEGLIREEELLVRMRSECIKRARQYYGVDRMANQFKAVYADLGRTSGC